MFEILCATMNQTSFSKIDEMNIRSNVIFANQTSFFSLEDKIINGKRAIMINTKTKGVGINRNLALALASSDLCLFSDDDVKYLDDMEEIVTNEFVDFPDADVIIFNFISDSSTRKIKKYEKTHRIHKFSKKPWATFQIAFKLNSIRRCNINFSTLFGGGCIFPCGEDSLIIRDFLKNKLKVYVSSRTIGEVSFKKSSWFTGFNKEYFYGQGAYYQYACSKTKPIWFLYVLFKTKKEKQLSVCEKIRWLKKGALGFRMNQSYNDSLLAEGE